MYNTDMVLDDVQRRALVAYAKTDGDPLPSSVTTRTIDKLQYVVLKKGSTLLACYRVRNDGKLKRLVRLPDRL